MASSKVQNSTPIANGAFATRIGGRKENQDNCAFFENDKIYVATVCDGMGGGPGGKTASTIAVRSILETLSQLKDEDDPRAMLEEAVSAANNAIRAEAEAKPSLRGMGSTCTILLLTEKSAFVAHVGDSRVYQFRGKEKIFRTDDHSKVFEDVKRKLMTEEEARVSNESNIITRALGIGPHVEPTISEIPYLKGDRFMLSTDGVHGSMPEPELIKIATKWGRTLFAVADNIAVIVDNIGYREGGGHDNLTLFVVEPLKNSKLKPKMTKQIKVILTILIAICIISITCNIFQAINQSDLQKKLEAQEQPVSSTTTTTTTNQSEPQK